MKKIQFTPTGQIPYDYNLVQLGLRTWIASEDERKWVVCQLWLYHSPKAGDWQYAESVAWFCLN